MILQILALVVDICKLFFIVKLWVNGSKFPCTLAKLSVLKLDLYRESANTPFWVVDKWELFPYSANSNGQLGYQPAESS